MISECGCELIHGNRDDELNTECATYTICRARVPRSRLVAEIENGLHPAYYVRQYPGGKFAAGKPDARFVNNINKPKKPNRTNESWVCAAQTDSRRTDEGPLSSFVALKTDGAARMVEFIHGERGGDKGRNESYTVCRLGVPRQRVVDEIKAGMHPGYELATVVGVEYPRPDNSKTTATWQCPMMSPRP